MHHLKCAAKDYVEKAQHYKHNPSYIMDVVGPFTWGILHNVMESIPCESCAMAGASMMRAMHDLVNHHLGKPIQYPADLKQLAEATARALASLEIRHTRGDALLESISELVSGCPLTAHKARMKPMTGMPLDYEIAISICQDAAGHLRRGNLAEGDFNSVSLIASCPLDTRLVGTFHTHPLEKIVTPSEQDLSNLSHMDFICMGNPESGELRCIAQSARAPKKGEFEHKMQSSC